MSRQLGKLRVGYGGGDSGSPFGEEACPLFGKPDTVKKKVVDSFVSLFTDRALSRRGALLPAEELSQRVLVAH